MKLKVFFLVCALAISAGAYAQQGSVTLLTFAGYTFDDKIDFTRGYGKIKGGFQWGAGLEFGLSMENAVEVVYQLHSTEGEIVNNFLGERETGEVNIHYILVGGTRYLPISDVLSGFGSVDAGLAVFAPDGNLDASNTTRFAWGLRAGLRMAPSDRVSLRIHAQMLSPVQGAGGGFYFGTGGSGVGVSTYSTIYQFNLGGSVNIRIK
jgi:opacity protein-like surface antigen